MHLILALVTSLLQAFATGNQPECEIYLAPSLTPGMGRGVFAGTPLAQGGILENSVTLAVRHLDISHWQLNNYVWATDDDETSLAELGVGMLHNHNNPPTISHLWPSHFKSASEQQQSHTTYSTLYSVAQRDIAAGEEIFVSYSAGNTWLEQRGIIVEDIPEKDVSAPPVRSAEELKSIGICMTDVKVDHLSTSVLSES